jgi:hypothetical protein
LAASRFRTIVTVACALLLLGVQREVQVHALQHLGSVLHSAHDQGIQQPTVDLSCLECSLLAGGAPAVAPDVPGLSAVAIAASRVVGDFASRSLAAPSYYSSRAPPSFL